MENEVKRSPVAATMRAKGETILGNVVGPCVILVMVYGFGVRFDPGHEAMLVAAFSAVGSTLQTIAIRRGWF